MNHLTRRVPPAAYKEFLTGLKRGDSDRAVAAVLKLGASGYSAQDIVEDVIAPAQSAIGQAWESGAFGIAQEHQATAISEEALEALLIEQAGPPSQTRGRVALCAAENEWHSIAARMVAVIWRHMGWDVRLILPSAPAESIVELLQIGDTRVVGVSCALPANLVGAWRVIGALRRHGCWIVAGGRGFGGRHHGLSRATALGADTFAVNAETADASLQYFTDTSSPPPRGQVPSESRISETEQLMLATPRIVADGLGLIDGWMPQALSDPGDRKQAHDDLSLFCRALQSSLLLDDERILAEHVGWYRAVLASSGADPETAALLVDAIFRCAPPGLSHARDLIVSAH